jgi:hypothetical protein
MSRPWLTALLSAVIGIAVTVVGAVILDKVRQREPHLVYSVADAPSFNGPTEAVSIYQVTVMNDGKGEVEKVSCAVRIPRAKIEQYRTSGPTLVPIIGTLNGDTVLVDIANLNPQESVQISVLASGGYLPSRPEITVRARGLSGVEEGATGTGQSQNSLWAAVGASLSSVALSFIIFFRTKRGGFGSQKEVLAKLCRIHGLAEEADDYDNSNRSVQYYSEADRLTQWAIDNSSVDVREKVERVLLGLLAEEVARSSKALVLCDLARLAAFKNDISSGRTYLASAKEIAADEVSSRLRTDQLLKKLGQAEAGVTP